MAKTNKYASINFNHIHEKNLTGKSKSGNNPSKNPSSSSSSFASATYSSISSPNKSHGRMLVLTRPTPKPITPPPVLSPQIQSRPQSADHPQVPDLTRSLSDSDSISLRPLGRTGTGAVAPSLSLDKDKGVAPLAATLVKPEKFVPPHLRAGFVGKEERHVNVGIRAREGNQRQYGNYGSPNRYGEDGRPKSGGGYERMRGPGEADLGAAVNRPRSSGNPPSSSGCDRRSF